MIYKDRKTVFFMNKMKIEGRHEADWVTISSDEYESMKSTIEVLSDPELMEQIRQSREDVKAGRVSKLGDFLKQIRKK